MTCDLAFELDEQANAVHFDVFSWKFPNSWYGNFDQMIEDVTTAYGQRYKVWAGRLRKRK